MDINMLHSKVFAQVQRGGGILLTFRKIQWKLASIIYSFDIPYGIDLTGVYLCHSGFGIVVNPEVKIGHGTVIQHSVTIGEMDGSHKCPIIGENCFIGCRASILGDIRIGNNVKIGSGAVVIHDVPDNCTVVGIPARIVNR